MLMMDSLGSSEREDGRTDKSIRCNFDADEEQADEYYQYLKQIGGY